MLNIPSSSSGGKGIFSGHGKVGTCRTAQKRHARAQIEGITKSDIRRLARKGGVKRISSFVYDDARQILKNFLEEMLKRSITFCEYSRRRTVSGLDVV
jgi:histone H4